MFLETFLELLVAINFCPSSLPVEYSQYPKASMKLKTMEYDTCHFFYNAIVNAFISFMMSGFVCLFFSPVTIMWLAGKA